MKKLLMTTAALAALCVGPLSTSSGQFDNWSLITKAEAGNGNGGGNNGNAGGNGGNAGNAGNSSHGNSGLNGKALGTGRNSSDTDTQDNDLTNNGQADSKTVIQDGAREKNLHAVLGRINSIGRNVNGLMNSKDPHLAAIRTYVLNSVELANAQTAADAARAAYDAALADYADAGLTGDPATTLSQLTSALASADTGTATALYEQIDVTNALLSASNQLVATDARVAQYSVLASDAALLDALASMSNKNLSSSDFSSETLQWAKAVLGVGDATGTIDAYMAQ